MWNTEINFYHHINALTMPIFSPLHQLHVVVTYILRYILIIFSSLCIFYNLSPSTASSNKRMSATLIYSIG
jgi:hypothetical protein